jgi:uncharacterized protein with HEPN domain
MREYGDYIEDILDSINAAEEFIVGMNFEDFEKDRKTIYAVIRAIEVIGESAKNIPLFIRKRYPEIPWGDMTGMRDRVIHGYFGVDLRVVWETATHDLSMVRPLVQRVLEDLGEEEINRNKKSKEKKRLENEVGK